MKTRLFFVLFIVLLATLTGLLLQPKPCSDQRMAYELSLKALAQKMDIPMEEGEGKEKTDNPGMAAYQDFLLTMDPALGMVPLERRAWAWKQTRLLQETDQAKSSSSLLSWQVIPSEMGGRARAILWDPNDLQHKKIWAGGVTGGLWYNTDITNAASGWVAVNDFWPGLAVSCIAYDPDDTQVMYVGTGEAQTAVSIYRESSGRGYGIWKSSDGGSSWDLLPSTESFAYVTDMVVRSENGNSVIYAGVVSGKYMGASHLSLPTDGLYRSSDGGATWSQVLPDITGQTKPYAVSDIDISGDSSRVIVGTMRNLDGLGGAVILYSDAGTYGSWTVNEDYADLILGGAGGYSLPGRVMVACAPSDANTVYAAIAAGMNNGGFDIFHGRYIIKSTDKGQSWVAKNKPAGNGGNDWATIAWHALTLAVDPNDPNKLWAGGLDQNRSTDGGNTWEKLSDWALMYQGGGYGYIHADQHAIVYKPGSSGEILFGSDGGVFYTPNATANPPVFFDRNKNFSTLQFYTADISPTAGNNEFVGGLQDNGCLWYQGNSLSLDDMVSGGDGACCFFDKNDPQLFITSIYYNVYYVHNGSSLINYISDWQSGFFINPADYDYRFNTLYANASSMFGDHQDELLRIKDMDGSPLGEFIPLNTGSTVPYSHVKVSPNSTLTNISVFVGTMSGRLFKLSNCQNTPLVSEIGSASFPTGSISCVAVGHSDDTLLVTFSNYGLNSVWQTYDGGASWASVEGNLPDMPVRWAVYHPQNSRQAILATETGVWTSSSLDQNQVWWGPANEGLANVRVDMLSIRPADNVVVAATHGRGLAYGTYSYDPTSDDASGTSSHDLRIFPNPSSGIINIDLPFSPATSASYKLYSTDGRFLEKSKLPQGKAVLNIKKYGSGSYIIHLKVNEKEFIRRIIIA